jgi:hypothetical protein
MNQNEQYTGGIKKKITAELVQGGMNGERSENRQEKANCTHTHPARYEKQRSCDPFNRPKKREMWICMTR